MKTSELIAALGQAVEPAAPMPMARRLAPAIAIGSAAAFVLLLAWLGLRPLDVAVQTRAFWMKAGYTGALSAGALMLVTALSRPARAVLWAPLVIGVAVAVVFGLGAMQIARTPPGARLGVWMGQTAMLCPWRIAAFAAPILAGLIVAMRRLAPTRPAAAGAAAGLAAGALGACVYEFFCQESGAAFVATWYTLGIAGCAALGAVLGSRLLRW